MLDPQHIDEGDDPRLNALMEWRQRLVDSGAASRQGFKEAHLRLVLRSGRIDVESIRSMLPGSVAAYAEDLARLLSELPSQSPASPQEAAGTEPARVATARPVDELRLPTSGFSPFTFGEQRAEVHTIGLRRRKDPEDAAGGLELAWPSYLPPADTAQDVVIYRVVSADDHPPYSPDRAQLLSATTATSTTDERPSITAVRHYQVWVNTGPTVAQALAAQPVKHAAALIVCPVNDVVIRQDNGHVIGHWTVPPAVSAVFVYRLPVGDAGHERPHHRILADSDNLGGFVDTAAEPGQTYLYRMRCASMVDGVLRLSEAGETTVEVAAVMAPVTDLSVRARPADPAVFDLTWTPPPAGKVVVYRSSRGPDAGAKVAELAEASLEQIGLDPELRLAQPVSQRHGSSAVMAGVSWPSDWSRAYFTPVTLLAGRAVLGVTRSCVRAGEIHDVDLAEYTSKQVLTFDWPTGAAAVVVQLAAKGHDPRDGLTGKSFEISLEEYEKYGGLRFTKHELPAAGCSLHLAPVAFSGGRRVTGNIRSIEYPGLLRLTYALRITPDADGLPARATIALRSQYDLPGSPAFVLIHNPTRMPLSVNDGEPLDVAPVGDDHQSIGEVSKELRWSALTTDGDGELWVADVGGRQGWIRLFVNSSSSTRLRSIALLDPPVESLHLPRAMT